MKAIFCIEDQSEVIAALTAERDAAVARADFFAESAKNAEQEGERRATAAIVAYLGDEAADFPGTDYGQWVAQIADAIERRDHLKPAP